MFTGSNTDGGWENDRSKIGSGVARRRLLLENLVHRAQLALEPLEPSTEHVRKRDPERRIGLAARDVEGRYIDLVAPSQSDRPHKKNQRNEGSHRGTRDDDGFDDGHRDDRIPASACAMRTAGCPLLRSS
jgi:hypothetical protein